MKKLIKKSQRTAVELYVRYGMRDCCMPPASGSSGSSSSSEQSFWEWLMSWF